MLLSITSLFSCFANTLRVLTFENLFFFRSADAAFYAEPSSITLTVTGRSVNVVAPGSSLALGHTTDRIFVSVQDLPVNDVTVSIVPTSAAAQAAFQFQPSAQLAFGPASPYVRSFVVQAQLLGTFTYNVILSGTDAAWYTISGPSQVQLTGALRAAPTIALPVVAEIIPGVLQGPFTITVIDAPDAGLTITPSAGDWTFTPATVSIEAGKKQAVFQGIYRPEQINTQVENAQTQIFYTLGGADVNKYSLPASSKFLVSASVTKRVITITPQTVVANTFAAGVSTAVRITLAAPPPTDVTLTLWSAGFNIVPAQVSFAAGAVGATVTVTSAINPSTYYLLTPSDPLHGPQPVKVLCV